MKYLHHLFLVGLIACLGCGVKEAGKAFMATDAVGSAPGQAGAPAAEPAPRKIIYTAQVESIVDDFESAQQKLQALIDTHQGCYVAQSEIHDYPGSPRYGVWTIRVPADHFNAFKAEAEKLGELRQSSTNSDDITDKYYDLEAHIKNDEVAEQGLQKLYEEKAANGRLEDLRAIMDDLRKIRGEIDSEKGQLNRWQKETELSTVTVTIYDRKDYVPPTTTFSGTVGKTFHGSVEALIDFGKFLVLVAVALAPWLPVLAVPVVVIWLLIRRFRKRRPAEPPTVVAAD